MQQKEKTTADKQQKKTKKGNLPKTKRSRSPIMLGAALSAAILLYLLIGSTYRNVFFPGTFINGVNVSGLTPAKAREAVNADAASYTLTLIEDGDHTETISGRDIDLHSDGTGSFQLLLDRQNMVTWGIQAFHDKEYSVSVSYDEDKLRSAIKALSCMDPSNWIAPEDAYVRYEQGTGYQIVPEVPGNEILEGRLFDAASDAVCHMEDTLSFQEAGIYRTPAVSSEDPDLKERLALLRSYSDMTVTYEFGDQREVLNGATLSEWISVSRSGRRTIDREAVAEYVKGLAQKYNTAYSSKTLETSYGETVTIKNGYYGWLIDKEGEVEKLMEIIGKGESTTREPVYLLEAASHDGPDYGDTYVEINLTAQHLFFYRDGELVIESDFVSGNPSRGNATPDGAYSLTYKERNATLKGQNYSTPVSYWMPFNGNVGMHDSSWRSTFGGSIYKTNGSHGCINLPPAVAKIIFENIEQGIPVLCYHLSGTEQAHATNLSGEEVFTDTVPAEPEPVIPATDEMAPPDVQTPLPDGSLSPDLQLPAPEGMSVPQPQIPPENSAVSPPSPSPF